MAHYILYTSLKYQPEIFRFDEDIEKAIGGPFFMPHPVLFKKRACK